MNEQVREAVKSAMGERKISQGELARRLEVDRPSITRLLSGTSGKVPKLWQEVLDALDLELVVQPKKRLSDQSLEWNNRNRTQ
ncbi:helix-turn-helix domain-containing protein [Deinococcus hohokamensis]|uniref:Helix-turn-helix domain-containing protein n=1 Tax=Deinococcus hohokamensis TaxID=309883 RepID=A0ABV9ICK3_9DEIO